MQEFNNSVLGRSGADGRRLRGVYSEFIKRNGGIEWSSVGGDDTVLKIMPAATDGVVYIYRRDVRITWDSKNYKILDVNDMGQYDIEVPFHIPDDEWNRYCGLCVLGTLVVHGKTVEEFADYIHCDKRRALNMIHGKVDICSYEAVGLMKWFEMSSDELFGR